MGADVSRRNKNRLPELGNGFVNQPLTPKRIAKIVVGFHVVRLQFQCDSAMRNRLVELFPHAQGVGEIAVSLGIIGSKSDRFAIGLDGFLDQPLFHKGVAKIAVKIRGGRVDGDGPANHFNRLVRLSPLKIEHPEQLHGPSMPRLALKKLAIEPLRFRKIAGAMLSKSSVEGHGTGD